MKRYTVHFQGAWVRDCVHVNTHAEAVAEFRRFIDGTGSTDGYALLYPYDERDNRDETHGDYALAAWFVGARGGIARYNI